MHLLLEFGDLKILQNLVKSIKLESILDDDGVAVESRKHLLKEVRVNLFCYIEHVAIFGLVVRNISIDK